MVINENNSHINSFTKGMNSDLAYDQIQNTQYTYAKNVRITKNQLLGEVKEEFSPLHEGVIAPVPKGDKAKWCIDDKTEFEIKNETILATDSIDNLGVIITTSDTKDIKVYRFHLDETTDEITEFVLLWKAKDVLDGNTPQLSAMLYKELQNVIKLYIATGTTPIVEMRVDGSWDDKLYNKLNRSFIDVKYLINNRLVPTNTVRIENVIAGRLKTSLVLYTYRYYNKYGNSTQLAPLTNKIQVINQQKTKEIGCAEDTETSIGFSISIAMGDYPKHFERLLIYRLSYIKPGEDSTIHLIYDDKIKTDSSKFVFNDAGIEPLQELTIEEFAAMSGLIVVPKVITNNQAYMFCANTEDDTIIRDIEISTKEIKIKAVQASVILATGSQVGIPTTKTGLYGTQGDTNKIIDIETNSTIGYVTDYLNSRNINSAKLGTATYNDIITSSLLRSLRRGREEYKYGIVYYDEYGRRSDVMELGTIITPDYSKSMPFYNGSNYTTAKPIGVKIQLPTITKYEDKAKLIGFLIVRRSSADIYQKTLLQVATARPVSQYLYDTIYKSDKNLIVDGDRKLSPYYPTGFLATNDIRIYPGYQDYSIDAGTEEYNDFTDFSKTQHSTPSGKDNFTATTRNNRRLYLIFSSEIDFRRDDVLHRLTQAEVTMTPIYFLSGATDTDKFNFAENPENSSRCIYQPEDHSNPTYANISRVCFGFLSMADKNAANTIFNYYEPQRITSNDVTVNSVRDVRMANWNDGFTEIQYGDDGKVIGGIKKYQSFTTSIDDFKYNNWVSFARYGLRIGGETLNNLENEHMNETRKEIINLLELWNIYAAGYINPGDVGAGADADTYLRYGMIGPGPSCLLATLTNLTGNILNVADNDVLREKKFYTHICNIKHTTQQGNYESSEHVQYFGFGNFFTLDEGTDNMVNGKDYVIVFDGDIYITPHELCTIYKAYNFESRDSLPSWQIVNYVPLESKVNTYFDYGMNYLNTSSANLLYEPGSIDGVTTQERPVHQYNMIYSDNDVSNDVFTLITTDKNETNQFKLRAYFSEPKTNGEFIDNFLIFKPASFIDVDSRYGQITNLLSDKNMLYYWQDHAFGKFSVNERSLVNDTNGNTIMLGQAGILSRYDYISVKYGMRLYDFCATDAEQGVYWVDVNNKAVVAANSNQAINYGEQVGVQNIINNKITADIPKVDYDLQNNELLCKCLGEEQIVFNVKYNFATSIYTRDYKDIVYIKNHLYGVNTKDNIDFIKYNYLQYKEGDVEYLSPLKFAFVINPSASVTKVFDNQLIVPVKRDSYSNSTNLLANTTMSFETDIVKKADENIEAYTDREGNILYSVPRHTDELGYGSRIRGKWMKVNVEKNNPDEYFAISHVLTKFRQSFS